MGYRPKLQPRTWSRNSLEEYLEELDECITIEEIEALQLTLQRPLPPPSVRAPKERKRRR